MFRSIFENIVNIIYSILYADIDKELSIIIKENITLLESYGILLSKYHTYYDLYNQLFHDNHKNTIEYNNLVDSYNNLKQKNAIIISENKNLKRKLMSENKRSIKKKLY